MKREEIIAGSFFGTESPLLIEQYGNGHINDTFRVAVAKDTGEQLFILQRINRNVFHRPDHVMENVLGITRWIAHKLREAGEDEERGVLHPVLTLDGKPFHRDDEGEYWRAYRFIDNTICFEQADTDEVFFQSGLAFGNFQRLLSDYPAETLHETIVDFHNTPVRYRQYLQAVENDGARNALAREEIAFLQEHSYLADRLENAARAGVLPLRVTHNDTKLNNVLFDRETCKPVCVLDLDTVMPGYLTTDFGDAIRFGASTAAEDEQDLDKVHFDMHLYEVYARGFIEGCQSAITPGEISLLPDGAMVITYEQSLRFLADFLNGDTYYKTTHPMHNLERARTQIRLLEEMEQQEDAMRQVIASAWEKTKTHIDRL